jgi:hypothetical protein
MNREQSRVDYKPIGYKRKEAVPPSFWTNVEQPAIDEKTDSLSEATIGDGQSDQAAEQQDQAARLGHHSRDLCAR